MANPKLRILYAEGESEDLSSHSAALTQAGHKVQTASGRKDTQRALDRSVVDKSAYDLVILGSSMTRDDRHHLPYMAKRAHRQTKVLVLHADGGRHPASDGFLDTGSTIEHVLSKVTAIGSAKAQPTEAQKTKSAAAGK